MLAVKEKEQKQTRATRPKNNPCSTFFNLYTPKYDMNASQMFSRLHITESSAMPLNRGAKTDQDAGIGATVILNSNGPFFNYYAGDQQHTFGGLGFTAGTLQAQEAILFHEFGHTIGALKADGNDFNQSLRNNGTVAAVCGSAIGK